MSILTNILSFLFCHGFKGHLISEGISDFLNFSVVVYFGKFKILKSYILRRPQNFAKSSPYFDYSTQLHTVKSKVKISHNFVAFSEYINFRTHTLKLNVTTVKY